MWRFFVGENIPRRRCTLACLETPPAPPRRHCRPWHAVPVGVSLSSAPRDRYVCVHVISFWLLSLLSFVAENTFDDVRAIML